MSPDNVTSIGQLTKLREGIIDAFNLEEVRLLVFDLGENYDDLRGETISAKIQALLEHLEKHRRIPDLLDHLKQQRPNADWDRYFPAEPEAKSPYKGLQYFTEADAHLFFGREQLTALLVERLKKERFLVVVGASGSGKSSLVRAGLVPAIRRGVIEGNGRSSQDWPIHIITPTDQPLKTLAVSLTRDSESVTAATTLAADLQKDSHSLDLFLMRQMANQPDGRLLLVVDQFEELFTQCEDKEVRQQFVDNLVNAVQSGKEGRLKLVLTLRADFYAHAVEFEALQTLLETGQQIVRAMSRDELEKAITQPAQESGWQFQGGLVEQILVDVGSEPGALPLLSHALQETWNRREGRVMTLAGYQAAGGVRGAIAKTADTVYANLPPDQQILARTIFLRLTELGEGTEDTRRRVWQSELARRAEEQETVTALLQQLANARLITTDTIHEQDGDVREVVEVSHEALIREWPSLRNWLSENREWLHTHRRITQDSRDWLAAGRDVSLLYRGGRLAQVREQTVEHQEELNENECTFIEASVQEEERRAADKEARRQRELAAAQELAEARQGELEAQKRRTSAVRRAVAGLALLLVIAIIATIFAIDASRQATIDAENAATSEANAQAAATQAVSAQGMAQAEATRADENLAAAQTAEAKAVTEAANAIESANLAATREAEAIVQAQIARSQVLAVSSQSVADQDPMEALLLAIAAGKTAESGLAMEALNQQLSGMSKPVYNMIHAGPVEGVVWNKVEDQILTWQCNEMFIILCMDSQANVWNTVNPMRPSFSLPHAVWVRGAVWNEAEDQILTWGCAEIDVIPKCLTGVAEVWDAANPVQPLFAMRHDDLVWDAAWNKVEDRILTWSDDGTAKVWDVADPTQPLFTLSHTGTVRGAIWNKSEDRILTWGCEQGQPLVSICRDSTANLWDVNNPSQPLLTLAQASSVHGAAWNEAEDRILTWGCREYGGDLNKCIGSTTAVWDVSNPSQPLFSLSHAATVDGAVWNEAEDNILTWGCDEFNIHGSCIAGTARVWDVTNPAQPLFTLAYEGIVGGATWNRRENRILTWGCGEKVAGSRDCLKGSVDLWDVDNPSQPLFTLAHEDVVSGATWDEGEDRILSWSEDNTAKVWVVAAPVQPLFNLIHEGDVRGAVWNEAEDHILTWSSDGTARVWNVAQQATPLLTLTHTLPQNGMVWNRTGDRILTWSSEGPAKVWNVAEFEAPLLTLAPSSISGTAWNRTDEKILTWNRDGTVQVWDVADLKTPLFTLIHETEVRGAVWNEAEDRILTWGCDEENESNICISATARVWDVTNSDLPLFVLSHEGHIYGAAWNEAGDHILTWSEDDTAKVWDVVNPEAPLLTLVHDENRVDGAAWNQAEDRILTWDIAAGNVKVWDVADPNQPLFTLVHENEAFIEGAAWNKAGDRILTWSRDGTTKVWDVANPTQPLLTLAHEDSVEGAIWNREEDRILTWSEDGTVKVWDAETGERLFTLFGDGNGILVARWNQDESRILLRTDHGHLRVYYTSTRELADLACEYTTRNFNWEEWQFHFPGQEYERTCAQWPIHPSVPLGQ